MSKIQFLLEAKARKNVGKGASRRLRRLSNEVPAIIYGAGKDPSAITLRHDAIIHAIENEAFFTHILELNVDGEKEQVIIKDLQRHPAKPVIMHADFQRVRADEEIHVNIPLHFINETTCVGVKLEGGQISHLLNELEIRCLPKDLPEFIEVDVIGLHIGDSIHIADLKLPPGVNSVSLSHGDEGNLGIVQVVKTRVEIEEEPTAAAAPVAEDAAAKKEETKDGD